MSQARIILGLYHSFIPCENLSELEKVYQEKYKKILTLVYNLPEIKVVFYYSGPLFNWLEKNHPEYIAVLSELSSKKKVELLIGPYYEPILPLLSISDTLGQIEKMTTCLRKNLGRRYRGAWLPGSFWDQKLVSSLANSGLNYCFLDESYFLDQGIVNPSGYYQTEDQGKSILLFPYHSTIAHSIASKKEIEIKSIIKKYNLDKQNCTSILFSGEELSGDDWFAWFESFIKNISDNQDIVSTHSPQEYIKETVKSSSNTIFLGNTNLKQYKKAYSLWFSDDSVNSTTETQGHYKSYFSSNPACNYVYGKSTYTSILINQIRGDRSRKKIAREYLWKGQNLFSYWDSEKAFLSSRMALRYLMEAEKLTREKGIFKSSVINQDLNNDGDDEFIFQGNYYNCALEANNGSVFQLDYLPDCWNYFYNELGRSSFNDIFLTKKDDFKDIKKSIFNRIPNLVFNATRDDKQIIFHQEKNVIDENDKKSLLSISKKYLFKRNWFTLTYSFKNLEEERKTFNFVNNIVFGLPSLNSKDYEMISLSDKTLNDNHKENLFKKSSGFSILDKINNTDIQVEFNLPMNVRYEEECKKGWSRGFNLNLYPQIHFQLYPLEQFDLVLTFRLSKHR